MITSQYIEDYLLSVHPNNELWEKIIKYIIKCSLNNLQPLELQHYPEILVYIDSKWQQAIFNILMLNFNNGSYIPMKSEWELLLSTSKIADVESFDYSSINKFFT